VDPSEPSAADNFDSGDPSDGTAIWTWTCERHLRGEIADRLKDGTLDRDGVIRRIQVVFRPGSQPSVRLDGEVRGWEVVEGRLPGPLLGDTSADESTDQNVAAFELPAAEAGLGHVTAVLAASDIRITFQGAADTSPIAHELEGAAHYVTAAERLFSPDDPTLPDEPLFEAFADLAHTAAEKLARGELLRLPDDRDFKRHKAVRSRYHEWAKLGLTASRFPELLDAAAVWQRNAKYDRSNFSLTAAEARDCIETLRAMREHAVRRPRRLISLGTEHWMHLMPDYSTLC
jgi:hypothetical protein